MIKVLRIIARLNIGGPAIHTILLTEGLDKSRFKSILVCGKAQEREGDMFYLAAEKGVQPIIIPQLGRSLNMRNDIIAFWKLFRLIRKERPDIIHTHTAKAGTLGRLAALLYTLASGRCILIHTFHGHVLHSYFGKIKSTVFLWIERFLAIFTDKIIAVSENLRNELLELKIAPADKIVSVPLGLELDRYLEIKNNGPEDKDYKSIGIIGRLVPVKNHKMFLQAAKRIKETEGLKRKIRFLIVGGGPLRKELESYAQKLGLSRDVTFTGWVKDLEKIYSQLDIVTLTSLNEGTPVALIEAQSAARVCVATNVGGVANVVEQGKGGLLTSSQNVEEFVQAIVCLLNDAVRIKNMGEYGRSKVKDKFDKRRLFNDIEKLYFQEILNIKKG